jgi:DNA polymerase I-like protein with 3'-5' exonuclease and polymerase domains
MELSDQHRQYLQDHAITDETIEHAGIVSRDDEIVFPWRDGDNVTEQRRPWPGESGLYYWETDKDLHFWVHRDAGADAPVLIVEGTKQSLAAMSYADPSYTIMGMPGCWGWSKVKLSRFKGRQVYLCLDADAATNLDVYEAGEKLGEKLARYGVTLRYLRIPGSGSQGLDDYLASLDEDERAEILAYEIEHASGKPADRKPTSRKRKMESDLPDTGGRPGVAVNLDRKEVIDKITGALKDRWNGKSLFNYGEVLTRVKGHETEPLTSDRFYRLLADTVACFKYSEATDKRPALFEPTWPDSQSIGAVMASADEFTSLTRVVRAPFLRPDGTVCSAPGYDSSTSTVLVPGDLDGLEIPEEPDRDQTRMAAKYLLEEWLGDLPFKTEADRANALALVLTPFIRGIVPLAPLAVVSGLQMGVGKNLFADCIAILATGQTAEPLPYVAQEEEMRKQLTAVFAGGASMFVFDEAHVIEGAQLSRAITSLTYTDRVLGVSRMASFPNRVTWMSLGNQVQVNGDMARRVYWISLHPAGINAHDREASSFRHPDLKEWTAENRVDLVTAALTVLRGWWAAGRPAHSRGATMGSFEPWDRMMSGVTAYAGVEGFLTDVKERRSESDFSNSYWDAHVHWLRATFGDAEFTTRDVQREALRHPEAYEAPPGLEDASGKTFTRTLGQGYSKHQQRNYSGVRLVKAGMGHKSTLKWRTEATSEGTEGTGGITTTLHLTGEPLSEVNDAMTDDACSPCGEGLVLNPPVPSVPSHDQSVRIPLDLETNAAEELFTSEPGTFIKIAGVGDSILKMPTLAVDLLPVTGTVTVNGNFFDLLALDRHEGIPVERSMPISRDLRIAAFQHDPPTSYETSPGPGFKSYSLDALGERYLSRPKSEQGKALAKEFGGWSNIPADDPRLAEYCRDDLSLTRELDAAIPWDPYEEREAHVSAITARATLTGFKVDVEGLTARAEELAARSEAGKQMLAEQFGFPLTNKAGKPAAAPQRTKAGKEALEAALKATGFPVDNWPRGADGTLSLSKETMAFALGHAEKSVPTAVDVIRAVSEMNGTRNNAANVLRCVTPDGRVHPAFLPFQATGRWSVLEPGLTVLKKGTEDSERAFLLPDDDEDLVSIDLDQIDIRCVAAHSQDRNLLAILNDPSRDIHSEISVMAFGSAEKPYRHYAKSLDLGWLYGRGVKGMVENTPGVTMEAAMRVDTSMREQFGRVLEWQSEVREMGENGVLLDNGFGRHLRVDPSRSYTQAPAMMGQSTTRDLIAEGLLDLARRAPDVARMTRIVVHDEVVFSVPRKDREEIARIAQEAFTRMWAPTGASNPVSVTAGQGKPFVFGKTWAECYM